ncbi:hypothetical protein LCM02_10115 [Lutimonas saemankumensis]|uniref:hypothetical protein n=1 Tax=Lutimonas saemankumensis TaxID=483016 RepID=UPI001CD1DF52|nr:hypothetical protein [Lutimonas saemankumensis]MCA0932805.1 hypothetical protein [Lutimonas saemankumensis]
MKLALRILLFLTISLIGYGYYLNYENSGHGEKFIGIGVLILAFVLMPLFIYHRYRNKDLKNYSIKDFSKLHKKDEED